MAMKSLLTIPQSTRPLTPMSNSLCFLYKFLCVFTSYNKQAKNRILFTHPPCTHHFFFSTNGNIKYKLFCPLLFST